MPRKLHSTRKLTERERQITKRVADGWKNREIGAERGISEMVVKNALRVIFDKTGMDTRLELALWWVAREG